MGYSLETEGKEKDSRNTFDRTSWKPVPPTSTLKVDGNGVMFRRNHMEHTDDPGCKDHQELDLGS